MYDFSHWGDLPKISCQCITYGRPSLLNEAVESFLRQDYPGKKELVILNDCRFIKHSFKHQNIKIINENQRYKTIGEKRNACVNMCAGDIILPWDDDDISLPWRISVTIQEMKNKHYFKPKRFWYWRNGRIDREPKANVAHAMGGFSRELFERVDGYPEIQSGQDMGFEDKVKATGLRDVRQINDKLLYYIYKFPGTGSYHLSSHGFNEGYKQAAVFVRNEIKPGNYPITPEWYQDYLGMI